jgi:hypothetical protein
MNRTVIAVAAAALLASATASAQRPAVPGLPAIPGLPGLPAGAPDPAAAAAQGEAILAALEAAERAAVHPGDERLSCEALQTEFTAIVNDPALRSQIAAGGARAERDFAAMQAAQAAIPAQTAAAAAAAFTPGGAAAATAAAMVQAQVAQAAAAQRMQEQILQSQQLTALMPKFMRGEHLLTLATTKNCVWVNEAGVVVPGIEGAQGDEND